MWPFTNHFEKPMNDSGSKTYIKSDSTYDAWQLTKYNYDSEWPSFLKKKGVEVFCDKHTNKLCALVLHANKKDLHVLYEGDYIVSKSNSDGLDVYTEADFNKYFTER